MMKLICGISLIFFSVIVNVNSLQCYSCENCAKVTEDQLVTCEASTTVPPTTTPSGQTTTTPSGQTTTTPSGQTTTTPSGQATTTPSGQTTTTPSGQTTTTPSEQTTTTPGQTTTSSQTTPDITTTTILYETTTTPAPTTTTEVTTVTATQTTNLEPVVGNMGGSDANNAINHFASRVRREAVAVQEKADEYVCLTVKYKENNTDVVSRFCGLDADGKICEPAATINATCTTCKKDKCNSAVSIHISLILMFIAIVFRFI